MEKKTPKKGIPKAIREQVWIKYIGHNYKCKCKVRWCKNTISVFDFHVGHNKPRSKGGDLDISNLLPICSRCNHSMSNSYTIDQWNKTQPRKIFCCCLIT